MTISTLYRWLLPAALAAAGFASMTISAPVKASDDLVRVIVDVADVVLRGNTPYYRHGNYGQYDRLVVTRDRYGRPVYYRTAPRYYNAQYRPGPPRHAPAHGYRHDRGRHDRGRHATRCDSRGRCTTQYYDPRQDRSHRRDWRR
ncbi:MULTISPECIES: hypothetical protein [Luteimonas]|uniref:hypothetical protein n=1 Tax=Luteimonas TaxID=83614 RepID=UPI000C7BDF87|nr:MULTISPECIES: hypothetical protein [Luteimonas]